eukprot:CAMPEP_0198305188 /NCGR_PEP_ID=MMETSP1449-20131203/57779_1 /TAXON_ID=420275 /ORGANISM="Attheya septentrionalis, Strain CCMP2084" /LENGTH=1326 /DNA_ID=CAMNT_0044007719 /DNA_START=96 /DNA_END=4076 /DNA_ORIENTATION=+
MTSRGSKKQKQHIRWVCDICKVKSFATCEEACLHEESCAALPLASKSITGANVSIDLSDDSLPDIMSEKSKDSLESRKDEKVSVTLDKEASAQADKNDHFPSRRVSSRKRPSPVDFIQQPLPTETRKTAKSAKPSFAPAKPKTQAAPIFAQRPVSTQKDDSKESIKKRVPRTKTSKTGGSKKPMASIFGLVGNGAQKEESAMLAEHRAAEFITKRRAEQELERERQRKRNERNRLLALERDKCREQEGNAPIVPAFFCDPKAQKSKATVTSASNELSVFKKMEGKASNEERKRTVPKSSISKRESYPDTPRFPSSSHIMCKNISATDFNSSLKNTDRVIVGPQMLLSAQNTLQKSGKYSGCHRETLEVEDNAVVQLLSEMNCDEDLSAKDTLANALSSVLIPPAVFIDSDNDEDDAKIQGQLWSDKYSMKNVPSDVIGVHNQETANTVLEFISDWKDHRKRSSAKAPRSKSKKGSKWDCIYQDDEFWDSDEEEGLCNVLLLTGPTGSGKGNLVHAAAHNSDCVVLEINTTKKRGGQALKFAIEEATQSHSSLALLKRGNTVCDDNDYTSDNEEEQGPSLAVILIDEVDNLFENDGDAGFWSALSALAKKAKCPIVLTATSPPGPLINSCIGFNEATLTLPSPMECVKKMVHVAKMEGISWRTKRSNVNETIDVKERLCHIANLCYCDLRRIMNEMQLFAHASSRSEVMTRTLIDKALQPACKFTRIPLPVLTHPSITDVSPCIVSHDSFEVLTIRGRNFVDAVEQASEKNKGMPGQLVVRIGNQSCPSVRVLDDNTMLAICPPCFVPTNATGLGVVRDDIDDSITSRYAPVSILVKNTDGSIIASTDNVTLDHIEGSCALSAPRCWNIEYEFPDLSDRLQAICKKQFDDRKNKSRLKKRKNTDLSSDSENEFEMDCDPKPAIGLLQEEEKENLRVNGSIKSPPAAIDVNLKDFAFMFNKAAAGLDVTFAESTLPVSNETPLEQIDTSAYEMDTLAQSMEMFSDAAVLEDAFTTNAIPYLAGAVPGFGPDLVDGVPASLTTSANPFEMNSKKLQRNGSNKPPSIERIYASGWNESAFFFGGSDTYMTHPSQSQERRLVSRTHATSRQTRMGICDPVPSNSESQDVAGSSCSFDSGSQPIEDAMCHASNYMDESDMFLSAPIPTPILSLPSILKRRAGFDPDEKIHNIELFHFRRQACESEQRKAVLPLFPEGPKTVYSCLRLNVEQNVPDADSIHRALWLDYIPNLRFMAGCEDAADAAYDQIIKRMKDNDEIISSRRSTRQKRRLRRDNHFDRFLETRARNDSDEFSAKSIAKSLAKHTIAPTYKP